MEPLSRSRLRPLAIGHTRAAKSGILAIVSRPRAHTWRVRTRSFRATRPAQSRRRTSAGTQFAGILALQAAVAHLAQASNRRQASACVRYGETASFLVQPDQT